MNDLLKITYENDTPLVSARELHEFLEVETPFRLWFPRMTEYGFTDSIDYTPYNFVHPQNHQEIIDYQLTVEMAKEISMLQRTDKGKQARTYFIQLEKAWNTPEQIMARAIKIANAQVEQLKNGHLILQKQIEQDKPKVLFADAVASSTTTILVGELAKILKQNGVAMGQTRLFSWLRTQGYLIKRSGTDYNMPTQRAMEQSLFEIKETSIVHADGHTSISKTPKVTGKGQQYFLSKFLTSEKMAAGE